MCQMKNRMIKNEDNAYEFPSCYSPHHKRKCHMSQTQAGSESLLEPSRETCQPRTCALCGTRTWMPQNHKSVEEGIESGAILQVNWNVFFFLCSLPSVINVVTLCMQDLTCSNQTSSAEFLFAEKECLSLGVMLTSVEAINMVFCSNHIIQACNFHHWHRYACDTAGPVMHQFHTGSPWRDFNVCTKWTVVQTTNIKG